MKTLNNNIEESYCSFEVSKLLKDKGCDLKAQLIYYHPPRKKDGVYKGPGFARQYNFYKDQPKDGSERIHGVTHALAIEWIRVNFGKHVQINPIVNESGQILYEWFVWFVIKENLEDDVQGFKYFSTPQEAIEVALKYTLTKLI